MTTRYFYRCTIEDKVAEALTEVDVSLIMVYATDYEKAKEVKNDTLVKRGRPDLVDAKCIMEEKGLMDEDYCVVESIFNPLPGMQIGGIIDLTQEPDDNGKKES